MMMSLPPDRRQRIATWLAALASLQVVAMFAPMPTFPLWIGRLIARETSLLATAVALVALGLARTTRVRLIACAAAVLGSAPVVLALPLCSREHIDLSAAQYLAGAPGEAVAVERDVALEPTRPDLTADVYHAAGEHPHPFVVVVHGGSWQHGDKGEVPQVSRHLALAGFTAVDVRYRLAPEHRFPAPIEDVKCLLGRLRQQADRFHIDRGKGALLGRSAGGQIALMAAYSAGNSGLRPSCPVPDQAVAAVVSVYGPTDLAYGYDHPAWPDVVRGPESLEKYLGGTPRQIPQVYQAASPTTWVNRPVPPTLLLHGGGDGMVRAEHAGFMAAALKATGHPVKWLEIPLAEHGFDVRSGGIGDQIERAAVTTFLRETLR